MDTKKECQVNKINLLRGSILLGEIQSILGCLDSLWNWKSIQDSEDMTSIYAYGFWTIAEGFLARSPMNFPQNSTYLQTAVTG